LNLRVGDHVSFYRLHAQQKTYGTIVALVSGARGAAVRVRPEGGDYTMDLPSNYVELYAPAGASK